MESKSIVREKSIAFAIKIIQLYQFFSSTKNEFVLSKQLVRAGTSIGANIHGYSKKDFVFKMNISLKEANETAYWLLLLETTGYLENAKFDTIQTECLELVKMLTSIAKTSKQSCHQ